MKKSKRRQCVALAIVGLTCFGFSINYIIDDNKIFLFL
jgi:hypothetical protein